MGGEVFQNYCFGSKTQNFGKKPFKNGGRYYWIVLAKELVQETAEWNVYTKFEKSWSRRYYMYVLYVYKYINLFKLPDSEVKLAKLRLKFVSGQGR